MKKNLLILCSIALLSSCGTSQFIKDDISTLKSKVYHLETQNKDLTEKLDKLTQRMTIQEREFNAVSQELNGIKSDLRKRIETPIAIPIPTQSSSTSNSTKSSSTKSTTPTKSNSSSVSRSTSTYSGRCQATTKKGAQCKRTAQAGRNYCWQH